MVLNPKISVVLPHYQDFKFVCGALDCILNQSYSPYEIIVIDDGSRDGSADKLEKFCQKDCRIKFFKNDINKGAVFTTTRAIDLCSGDFIYGASSDDRVLPDFFENAKTLIERSPDHTLTVAQTHLYYTSIQEVLHIDLPKNLPSGYYSPEVCQNLVCELNFFIPGNMAIYDRFELQKIGGFPQQLMSSSDTNIILYLAFTRGINFICKPCGVFQIKNGSFTSVTLSDSNKVVQLYHNILEFLYDNPNIKFTTAIKNSGYLGSMPLKMILMVALSRKFYHIFNIATLSVFIKSISMRILKRLDFTHEYGSTKTKINKEELFKSLNWPDI